MTTTHNHPSPANNTKLPADPQLANDLESVADRLSARHPWHGDLASDLKRIALRIRNLDTPA